MTDLSNKRSSTPWKNGHYQGRGTPATLIYVEGETLFFYPTSGKPTNLKENPMLNGTLKYGDFGEAHPDVAKESGKFKNDVEITAYGGAFKPHAVLSDDGMKMTYYGMQHAVDIMEWKSEEEIAEFKMTGDPIDAIPHEYKEQPEKQGKILWLSGAPGLGKSTSGLLMSRKENYVYYEADCFMNHLNPYVPTDVDEPTLAMMSQKFLRGVPQQRIDDVSDGVCHFFAMGDGKEYDVQKLCAYYSAMAEDVGKEQKRIGGDFVVAQAVPTRALRDHIRTKLGSNLIFVVLHMSREDQMNRIKARHGDEESLTDLLTKLYNHYEPATEDEPNAIHVLITKDMSKDDVVSKILKLVKNYFYCFH
jgi:gluconate kinase